MYTDTNLGGNFTTTISFAPPVPRCNACGAVQPTRQTPDGKLWCGRCLTVRCAPDLLDLLFSVT